MNSSGEKRMESARKPRYDQRLVSGWRRHVEVWAILIAGISLVLAAWTPAPVWVFAIGISSVSAIAGFGMAKWRINEEMDLYR